MTTAVYRALLTMAHEISSQAAGAPPPAEKRVPGTLPHFYVNAAGEKITERITPAVARKRNEDLGHLERRMGIKLDRWKAAT